MRLRVISGHMGGQLFDAPTGHRTHPMSEKMRGAIFNALGDITGLTVLDAFAGSGALSFEALSRSAKYATAIDVDKSAFDSMVKASKKLGVDNSIKITRANIHSWQENNPAARFDIVLVDPPYNNLQIYTLEQLSKLVKAGGIYVLSYPADKELPVLPGVQQLSAKNYGDSQLAFYRKTG